MHLIAALIVVVMWSDAEAANVLVMHSLGIGSHVNTLSALSQRLMEHHGHKVALTEIFFLQLWGCKAAKNPNQI